MIAAEKEVDFVEKVLNLHRNSRLLDLPCGQGRHSVILAKRGYAVTGVDLSQTMLGLAKKLAAAEKVRVRFVRADMRRIRFENEFDAAINMFSSFGYFQKEADNMKALKTLNRALKPGGKLLLDLLNKDWYLERLPISGKTWWRTGSNYVLEEATFDKKEKGWSNHIILVPSSGKAVHLYTYMRLYTLWEIKNFLKKYSFKIKNVYGNYRGDRFSTSSPRMIILAEKIASRSY